MIDIELAKAQLYHKQKKDLQENFFNAVVWYGLKKSTDFLGLTPLSELEGITRRDVQHCYEQMLASPFYFSVISDLPRGEVESALEAVLKTRTAFEKLSNQPPDASQNAPYHRYIHPICLIFYFCFRAYNNFKTAS